MDNDFRELLDRLYQSSAQTTGSENTTWDYGFEDEGRDPLNVYAVDQDGGFTFVAAFANEADAEFVTLVHNAIATVVRESHDALDEADRADRQRDEGQCRLAEVELAFAALRKELLTA